MAIKVFRAHTGPLKKQQKFKHLLRRLPNSLHLKALRYKSELSAYNYVIGRLLLKNGLESFSVDSDLEKIEFQENGKLVLPGIHFNISHSDHQVICAFSKEAPLGVDIEKINPIDFKDFTLMMSKREWEAIKNGKDPLQTFYRFWTRKESIIKALGLKLSFLHKIELDVSSEYFVLNNNRYCLKDLSIGQGYYGAVCSEKEIGVIEYEEIFF